MENKKILKDLKKVPSQTGVYLFLGKNGEILYVGRANNLKQRILNYFQKNSSEKTQKLISLTKRIKYFTTETILESIILEANLIKKFWPKFNVREKDFRSFVYLVIPKIDFPQPFIVRKRELEKIPFSSLVFGPYKSAFLLRKILKIIRKIFPFSMKNCQPFSNKPCFDYQLGLCPGLCLGKITKEEYQKNIKNVILLFSGKKKNILKNLKETLPDRLKEILHLEDVIFLSEEKEFFNFGRIEGYDISHLGGKETVGAMVVFEDGKKNSSQYRLFKIKRAPRFNDLNALEEVLKRRFKHKEWTFPKLILIDGGRPQVSFLTKLLEELKINIPLIGISKYRNDEIVFSSKIKKSLRDLIVSIKPLLLKIREEAHRFASFNSKRERLKILKNKFNPVK